MARKYRILVAKTRGGLTVAAKGGWTILENTVRDFAELQTNDDQRLGDIGAVECDEPGVVALSYQDQ